MFSDLDPTQLEHTAKQESFNGSLDASLLDHLNSVVNFLHSEGFYAAEEALLREIEERFTLDINEEKAQASSNVPPAPAGQPCGEGTIEFHPNVHEVRVHEGLESAERLVEAWRSKSTTPVASPKKQSELSGLRRPSSAPADSAGCSDDLDEYDGDDDVGYWRQDVSGQEACLGIELELLSGDDGCGTMSGTPYSSSSQPLAAPHSSQSASPGYAPPCPPQHPHGAAARRLTGEFDTLAQQPLLPQDQEVVGTFPYKAPHLVGGGHSVIDRHAGTASWVYDRANSAGLDDLFSDALAQQQQQQQQQQWKRRTGHSRLDSGGSGMSGGSLDAEPSPACVVTLAGPVSTSYSRGHVPGAGHSAAMAEPLMVEAALPRADSQCAPQKLDEVVAHGIAPGVEDECNISRVSSLSEAMLHDALAHLAVGEAGEAEGHCNHLQQTQAHSQQHVELQQPLLKAAGPAAVAAHVGGYGDAMEPMWQLAPPAPVLDPGGATSAAARTTARGPQHGPALHSGRPLAVLTEPKGHAGKGTKDGRRRRRGLHGQRGSKGIGVIEGGGVEVVEEEEIDYADPFTFPVTSPSEAALPEPSPLFCSWPSFKNLSSPERKGICYSTDDDAAYYHRSRQHLLHSPMSWDNLVAAEDDLDACQFDQEAFDRKYQVMNLRVVARRHCTGFEESKELPVHVGDVIAGRYQVVDLLGQAAFSRAVQALDTKTGMLVCLKIIKNNKDYLDQSLDEIRLLQYINSSDPADERHILRLYDYFYFKEHLFLVCELLRANLYEFQKHNRDSGDAPYFVLPRIQSIARQVLQALAFLHSLSLIHADLKPENILIKSYSRCEIKVIDLGSSCYTSDHLSSYVQSRSYRSPEVILGAHYDQKIDVWSLGCIMAELCTGKVLFQNESLPTLLARMEGILGPIPPHMMQRGRFTHKYYTRQGKVYERNRRTGRYEYLRPKRTSLRRRTGITDELMLDFLSQLLQIDPCHRPSAEEALHHPWLQQVYPPPT